MARRLAGSARADVATVGSWAVHPGGPRILAAVGEATGIDRRALTISPLGPGRVRQHVVADGPLHPRSNATAKAPRPWVALAFGPGLAVEAVLLG